MIFLTSSTGALKMPTPETSLPSEIGQTIGNTPSARRAKFLRPCSQMIFSTPSSFFFDPAFKITMQYCLVVEIICRIYSSVMSVIEYSSKLVFERNQTRLLYKTTNGEKRIDSFDHYGIYSGGLTHNCSLLSTRTTCSKYTSSSYPSYPSSSTSTSTTR